MRLWSDWECSNFMDQQKSWSKILLLFTTSKCDLLYILIIGIINEKGIFLQVSNCGFIEWLDPEMCNRSMQVIPGLLRSKNNLEARMKAKELEAFRVKTLLCISWLFFVTIWFLF